MAYPIQGRLREGTGLLPEEQQVIAAMKSYCFDTEKTTQRDFTPTFVLYEVYRRFVFGFDADPDAPTVLNPTQFGIALRKAFELAPERKTRRRYRGQMAWGYLGVKGPDSETVHIEQGNPWYRRSGRRASIANMGKTHGSSIT